MAESGCGGWIVLGVIALGIYSCSHKSEEQKAEQQQAVISGDAPAPSVIEAVTSEINPVRGEFNEDRATDAARDSLSGASYEGEVGSSDCTDDCSGHEAGWQWAKDGNDCNGGSGSFDGECQAYASAIEEKVDEARSRYESGDDTFAGDE